MTMIRKKKQPYRTMSLSSSSSSSSSISKIGARHGVGIAIITLIPWCILSSLYLTSEMRRQDLHQQQQHPQRQMSGLDEGRNGSSSNRQHNNNPNLRHQPQQVPGQYHLQMSKDSSLGVGGTSRLVPNEIINLPTQVLEEPSLTSITEDKNNEYSTEQQDPIEDAAAEEPASDMEEEQDRDGNIIQDNDDNDEDEDDENQSTEHQEEEENNSSLDKSNESSSLSNSPPPPACDMIPIDGGRFMYRNRVRIADKDLTHICGPKVLFIGAQRCGMDTIADLYLNHPRVVLNQCSLINTKGGALSCHPPWFQRTKQGNYFNVPDLTHHRREDSEAWLNTLARRMPLTDGINTTTFEKSSTYMETAIFDDVAQTAHTILPNAKIVATVCHPAERLYSEFYYPGPLRQFYLDNNVSPPSDFTQFVDLLQPTNPICNDPDMVGFCDMNRRMYLSKGEYLNNLRPWIDVYGADNVLILNMDDSPEVLTRQLLDHTGLPEEEYPWEILESTSDVRKNRNFGYEGRWSAYKYFESHMRWLESYYAPFNDELMEYMNNNKRVLGNDDKDDQRPIDWPHSWNCRHYPDVDYCKTVVTSTT